MLLASLGENLEGLVLRKSMVWDPEKRESFVILTNHMKLGATTILVVYRDRWEIGKRFRLLKQNLRIKIFVEPTKTPCK